MLLVHGAMRVSHVTTHTALEDVPKRVTPERISRVVALTDEALKALNVPRRRMSLRALLHLLWERARTAKYGKNGHRHLPIKSSHFLGMGCRLGPRPAKPTGRA
jgi:hypothetical protein